MEKLEDILHIYKCEDLNFFIKKVSGFDLEERNLTDVKIKNYYSFVGDNPSNGSVINLLKDPEKGIVERVTNGIDAVLEYEKEKHGIKNVKDSDTLVKKIFPNFYQNKKSILEGEGGKSGTYEASDKVILAVNDGSKSNKPTIDIVDRGKGIKGENFINTILSINKGNKLSSDKNYLIGAFGQGGSTSLPHSFATIIISKRDNNFYYTVIKRVELSQYKNFTFVYLHNNGVINEALVENIDNIKDQYLKDFINSEGGTLVRMIETEISKEFRDNDVSKPGMLGDYINTELFNVPLPVKLIENRADYTSNDHAQNRNSFGSYMKLYTWKYARKQYCGSISIEHNRNQYNISYYIVLPDDEEKWGSDSECKKIYRQINVHMNPIIFTVNGQYISSEGFTKVKNAGLSFLQYRLLIEINLDGLGTEKYKFFTSDRSQIQNSDLTRGFVDKVIKVLREESRLFEINDIIAEKSINTQVDSELINNISSNVKNIYSKYLKGGTLILTPRGGHVGTTTDEEVFLDHVEELKITSAQHEFYKDENIKVFLSTKAKKSVNEVSNIILYIDGKANYDIIPSFMNGRIQYVITSSKIIIGEHDIEFIFFPESGDMMKSNLYSFDIIDEKSPTSETKNNKSLNIEVHLVDEKELIIDVSKDDMEKKIDIYVCLELDIMNEVYGKTYSSDAVQSLKNKLIEPMVLFVLFMNEQYEELETIEQKNNIVLSFVKTFAATSE
ncbi:MAG: hypothetical protein RSC93_07885 [Erysipelotrichaceae bacterium]|uniref:hypothetical protein n=1 Tax=Anaerorhabdus sp. TaxID=1872524 RepID=UPI002FCB8657